MKTKEPATREKKMKKIELPFSDLFICEICGKNSDSAEVIAKCEAKAVWETPDVKIGDTVKIYRNKWQNKRYVGLSEKPAIWTVDNLFYAKHPSLMNSFRIESEHHQLCIRLRARIDPRTGEQYSYNPKDGGNITIWKTISYLEFILWREGDREKLEKAGLVEKIN